MRVYYITLLALTSTVCMAHEFVQTQKPKRISLHSIKEQAGDIFAQQLRESAQIVQLLGHVQQLQAKDAKIAVQERVRVVATQLRNYSLQLTDLLTPMASTQVIYFAAMETPLFIGELITIMGKIQEQLIMQLNDLLDDTSSLFVKKHMRELLQVISSVKSYTPYFSELKRLLSGIQMPPSVSDKKRVVAADTKQ